MSSTPAKAKTAPPAGPGMPKSPLVGVRYSLSEMLGEIRQELDQLLARIQSLVVSAGKAIGQRYFDHAQGPQLLVKHIDWQDQL